MRIDKPTILITAEIDGLLLNKIVSKSFVVDVIPFIQTEIIRSEKVQQQIQDILKQDATIIFTSSNAVEAVYEYSQNKKADWEIYCIGSTTRLLIENLFGVTTVVGVAENATALAKEIIANKNSIKEVYFFCGDKRRNELPELLQQNNIAVNEIQVYTTKIFHHEIQKDYDGILFFSPSAVNGFFENNLVKEDTVLFAIGNTTATEIKKFSKNKIIVSDKPGKKELIEKMISFFES